MIQKPRMDDIPNIARNRLGRTRGVQDIATCRIRRRNVEKNLSQRAMESHVLALEAVRRRRCAASLRDPRQTVVRRDIENDSQVRNKPCRRSLFQQIETPGVDAVICAASRALIGARRIDETVAENPFAPRERRPDQIVNMIYARGGKQSGLGERSKAGQTP